MTPALARLILPTALALGLLADYLFRAHQPRAGFAVWCLVALGAALLLQRERERTLIIGAAAALVLLLVLREAPILYALNGFALFITLLLVAWRALGRSVAQLEPRDALIGGVAAVASLAGGTPTLLMRDANASALGEQVKGNYKTFGIGAIVALPVLLMVTGLLASADPLFAGFLDEAGALLDTTLAEHIGVTLATAWISAGALRGSLVPLAIDGTRFRKTWELPLSTFLPALGGLTLLLSAWIGLQVRAMFGGAAYVAATSGVTVAEYARNGFFELIVIAGMVLAVLLVTDDLLVRGAESARRSFRTLGGILIALVAAVLVSALMRLSLYLGFYGLTEDRVMALAVLVWVAAVLGWFAFTVLRGERLRFARGVLAISAVWLGLLNLANPERWVVETNVRRAERGLDFDIAYHATLSADALPALERAAERLGEPRATELRTAVAARWTERNARRANDWREWTLPYLLHGRTQ
ncbi:DUF4173 domain-containing protein [Pseudogemmatithrix spongiicola]|uniref:DUF4173 domain-containing protein n=1 Tax=Pseudogemmatithrix spongiicola TaxID=3062599 RepID=A0AA49JUH4_9BACT|nr:DUF4173 domain-containing protein [Gemmatimonadaceae bacterium 'strain 138']WKW14778.1 DUF4173 domain-containing protein [Gemmatimonadaceae bacterium 'strain 318']